MCLRESSLSLSLSLSLLYYTCFLSMSALPLNNTLNSATLCLLVCVVEARRGEGKTRQGGAASKRASERVASSKPSHYSSTHRQSSLIDQPSTLHPSAAKGRWCGLVGVVCRIIVAFTRFFVREKGVARREHVKLWPRKSLSSEKKTVVKEIVKERERYIV